jgi:hypothetical protein
MVFQTGIALRVLINAESKVSSITCYVGPEGWGRVIAILSLTTALIGVGRSVPSPG